MKIACILFAYNRPRYLKRAIKTHKKIEGLDYYAFIDYSEVQKKIYEIIDETKIYDYLYKADFNLGLNENIIKGITHVFSKGYDAVIVLEDDLLLSEDALEYLQRNLGYFADAKFWGAVSCQEGNWADSEFKCWAWGTWADRWFQIDWSLKSEKKNRDSWDVIMSENFKQKDWWCRCYPTSKVKHIGWSGIHYNQLDRFSIRRIWHSVVNYFG